MKTIIVGSRGSRLALAQTHWVIESLKEKDSTLHFEIEVIKTKGDLVLDKALDKIGDKGLFVKEIEQALIEGRIDMAVHSMKDMPGEVTAGLAFAKTPKREDPRDVLVLKAGSGWRSLMDLPQGAVLGTGSQRRLHQLKAMRPDVTFVPVRGNVETRMNKIETEDLAGVVLAAAGLKRLDLENRITLYLEPEQCIPAPAQGALAIQFRQVDTELGALLDLLGDDESHMTALAERAFLNGIAGSCHIPIGAYATVSGEQLHLTGLYGDSNGYNLVKLERTGIATFEEAEKLGKALAVEMMAHFKTGKVYLVGAGPGDAGLITVKGKQLIESAEVVVYDRLVSEALLACIPPTAMTYYVGKASSQHAVPQEDINQMLADLAKAGRQVVRLKGGDPYVFGRGGEEGELLHDQGVPFEVVPGVTSAIGGLGYAGIPITHRDWTSSFHVFTGHFKEESRDHHWPSIAGLNGTLVFLMGVANLAIITEQLLHHGMDSETPAAIVSNATRANQKTLTGTLGTIVELADLNEVKPPSLFVVGHVVNCREKLNWFEERPLFGKKIVVTRARHQASKLTSLLEAEGAEVLEIPAIAIQQDSRAMDHLLEAPLSRFQWVILTSENGVEQFMDGLYRHGLDARALSSVKIAVTGPGTARKLRSYGLVADLMPERFVAEGVLEALLPSVGSEDHVLIAQAGNARTVLTDGLKPFCNVTEVHLYESVEANDWSLENAHFVQQADWVTFTSASTVTHFMEGLKRAGLQLPKTVKTVSIGPVTTEAMTRMGMSPTMEAEVHRLEYLVEAVLKNELAEAQA